MPGRGDQGVESQHRAWQKVVNPSRDRQGVARNPEIGRDRGLYFSCERRTMGFRSFRSPQRIPANTLGGGFMNPAIREVARKQQSAALV